MLHQWRIKRKYYNYLCSGTKTLEVRVGYDFVKKVKEGDQIAFSDYSPNTFSVKRISKYQSFREMLSHEDTTQIIPHLSTIEVLHKLQDIYPERKERLGVYVLELIPPITIIRLSTIRNQKILEHYLDELYQLTDWICQDYPQHKEHYYNKYYPGLADGTREIIGCYAGTKPIGIAILKNTPEEKKISTLYLEKDYRGLGIASKLVLESSDFLGTTTPIITIAEYKVPQFNGLIQRFNWQHTSTLPKGYYNDHSDEWVFNE